MNSKEILKWLARVSCTAILWVFILSIRVNGQTMFYYANDLLVQNELVSTIDEGLGDLWYRVSETARLTFNNLTTRQPVTTHES